MKVQTKYEGKPLCSSVVEGMVVCLSFLAIDFLSFDCKDSIIFLSNYIFTATIALYRVWPYHC